MMTKLWLACLLVVLGCAAIKSTVGSVPTVPYTVQLCADGAVPIPCRNLGQVQIPGGGDTLVALVLSLAAPVLEQAASLKACLLTTYPAAVSGTITVTATAVCKLAGRTVSEGLTVTLAPVAPSS